MSCAWSQLTSPCTAPHLEGPEGLRGVHGAREDAHGEDGAGDPSEALLRELVARGVAAQVALHLKSQTLKPSFFT
jgi:hypothetical protein